MICPDCQEAQLQIQCGTCTTAPVWIEAHRLPVYAQCHNCHYAPRLNDQPRTIKQILQEFADQHELDCNQFC